MKNKQKIVIIHHRYLIYEDSTTLIEVELLAVSPSSKHVLLQYPNPDGKRWEKIGDFQSKIVEDLGI